MIMPKYFDQDLNMQYVAVNLSLLAGAQSKINSVHFRTFQKMFREPQFLSKGITSDESQIGTEREEIRCHHHNSRTVTDCII
jgi:hypothetical protein